MFYMLQQITRWQAVHIHHKKHYLTLIILLWYNLISLKYSLSKICCKWKVFKPNHFCQAEYRSQNLTSRDGEESKPLDNVVHSHERGHRCQKKISNALFSNITWRIKIRHANALIKPLYCEKWICLTIRDELPVTKTFQRSCRKPAQVGRKIKLRSQFILLFLSGLKKEPGRVLFVYAVIPNPNCLHLKIKIWFICKSQNMNRGYHKHQRRYVWIIQREMDRLFKK